MTPPPVHPIFGAGTVGGASVFRETEHLEELLGILGNHDGDLSYLLPYLEGTLDAAADVQDLSSRGLHAVNPIERDYPPVIRGDLLSQRYNGTDEYMTIADNALLSAIGAGVDVPASWGCAFMIKAVGTEQILIAKDDDVAATAREYALGLDNAEKLFINIYDDSVPATRGRYYNTALLINTWYVVVATYDGRGAANAELGLTLYLWNGATHAYMGAVDDTTTTAGVYVDMEDTAEPVLVGARNNAARSEWFNGEQMMPWMTRRELSAEAAERAILHMVHIMGV